MKLNKEKKMPQVKRDQTIVKVVEKTVNSNSATKRHIIGLVCSVGATILCIGLAEMFLGVKNLWYSMALVGGVFFCLEVKLIFKKDK